MSSPVVERTVEYQRANGYEYWPGNICGHVGLSSFTDAHSSYSKEFMSLPLKEHLTQAVFKPNWNLNEFDRHDHYISSCEYEAITSENISDCLIELQTEYPSVNVDRIYEQYRSRISS